MALEDQLTGSVPFSFEAEQSVLGAVIIDYSVLDTLIPLLRPEYFYMEQHRRIYETMLSMNLAAKPIDYVTLLDEVRAKGIFSEAEGKQYLLSLTEVVPSIENAENYARIIVQKAILRQMIEAADAIRTRAMEMTDSADEVVEYAEQRIYDITNARVNTGFYSLREGLQESIDRYNKMAGEGREQFLGTPTYFPDLDNLLGGMHNSDLIIVAARPGIGKSSLALNIAENVALKAKKKVAFFSLEMSNDQLVDRIISSQALVENYKLRTGELQDDDWRRIAEATKLLADCPIYFDDSSNITVSQMKAKLRRLKDVGLVIVDYLQLMSSGRRIENRVQEVSEMTRALKIMEKELNVPLIVLSQLARKTEDRKDGRPQLSDLRESGSIEQDADSVLFLVNDALATGEPERQNIMKIVVGKNRHGETGTVEVEWSGKYTKFSSLEKRYDAPM